MFIDSYISVCDDEFVQLNLLLHINRWLALLCIIFAIFNNNEWDDGLSAESDNFR